jgi:hypothetical protein
MPSVVGQNDTYRPEPGPEELGPAKLMGRLVRQAGRDIRSVGALAKGDEILERDLGLGVVPEDDLQLRARSETLLGSNGEGEPDRQGRTGRQAPIDEQTAERQRRRERYLGTIGES